MTVPSRAGKAGGARRRRLRAQIHARARAFAPELPGRGQHSGRGHAKRSGTYRAASCRTSKNAPRTRPRRLRRRPYTTTPARRRRHEKTRITRLLRRRPLRRCHPRRLRRRPRTRRPPPRIPPWRAHPRPWKATRIKTTKAYRRSRERLSEVVRDRRRATAWRGLINHVVLNGEANLGGRGVVNSNLSVSSPPAEHV